MIASGIDKGRSSSGATPASRGFSSNASAVTGDLANVRHGQSRSPSPVSVPTAAATRSDFLGYYPPALKIPTELSRAARFLLEILIERDPKQPIRCGRFVGRARALHREELRKHLQNRLRGSRELSYDEQLADERLRTTKEELVEAGHPVCSGQVGYWYAATYQEANEAAGVYDSIENDAKRKAAFLRAGAERIHGLEFL